MRQSRINLLIAAAGMLGVLAAAGCTKEKRDPPEETLSFSPDGPATLSTIQNDVILLGCAVSGCHSGSRPSEGLNLATALNTYNGMVNVDSRQAPGLKMIVPGDPDSSYLVAKLDGTHLTLGGTGVRMPQYAKALPRGQRDRIVQWILDGAPLN